MNTDQNTRFLDSKSEAIRVLNDTARDEILLPNAMKSVDCKIVFTQGVVEKYKDRMEDVTHAVKEFNSFDADNDPHCEHDSGFWVLSGQKLMWKIDYLDKTLTRGSEDPACNETTRRLLTVLLAIEY